MNGRGPDRLLDGQGFLLTRTSHDRNETTEISFWVATEHGPVHLLVHGQQPIFFIEQSSAESASSLLNAKRIPARVAELDLKTFDQRAVSGVYCPTVHCQLRAQDLLRSHNVRMYETDIRLHDRFLMERFICGGVAFRGQATDHGTYVEVSGAMLKPSDCRPALRTVSLDIECDTDESLFSVGLSGCGTGEVLMIGAPATGPGLISWCRDESHLLARLEERILELDPDVIVGWNVVNFDLRILLQRAARLKRPLAIGRGRLKTVWRSQGADRNKGFLFIPGRAVIDGIEALRSATYRFPSFSLEQVARTLLGRGKKTEHATEERAEEIRHNFLHDKQKLAAYNLEDCRLVEEIFTETRILDFLALRGQMTGLELNRAGGSVLAFSNLYIPRLHRAGYISPNRAGWDGESSPGGYVMDSRPGLYRNVLVLDFKSLYPSIIRTFKIDPLGMVEGLLNPQDSIGGFRGARFDRERHLLPGIITDLWHRRDDAKQDGDAVLSQAIKILMNSFYGVLGSDGCRFYDPRLASSITLRGQEIMKTTCQWIREMGYCLIYGDTDSIFVWVEDDLPEQDCIAAGRKMAHAINTRWQEAIRRDHALDCHLEIEFETFFLRFFMPTLRASVSGSKKRYAGLVPGPEDNRLVFKGLENVRTDWTPLARDFQHDLYRMIFEDKDPSELVRKIVQLTLSGANDDRLIYRKRLRRALATYTRNIPPHVRAAQVADGENARRNRKLRYQDRGWVEYVITVNGPEPVEYRSSAIDYDHYVDRQLKPVADGILPHVGLEFSALISPQTCIF